MIFGVEKKQWLLFMFIVLFHLRVVVKQIQLLLIRKILLFRKKRFLSSKTNPIIIDYANMIGRSPSALNMKIGNIGRLDPELKKKNITGLTHGAKMEELV